MRHTSTFTFIVVLSAILTVLPAAALAQAPARPGAPPAKPPAAPTPKDGTLDDYRIGPEDVLAISVWKNDAMSRVVPVRPDGMISLPLLDDVKAAGMTPMELRDVIAQKLTEFVPSPAVSVIVNEVKSFKVAVIGEVLRVGRYELKARTTVLDVLALAGGFNQFAARTRLVVIRTEGSNQQNRIAVNYNKVINGEGENPVLRPGDIIIVP
jgi:polysaccharide export outer membrane protein